MESNTKPRLRTRPTSRVSLAIVATIAVLIGLVAPQSIALANGFFSGEEVASVKVVYGSAILGRMTWGHAASGRAGGSSWSSWTSGRSSAAVIESADM